MNNANNDPIGNALGLNPIQNTINNMMAEAQNDSASSDFETARANVLTVIENGQEAISTLSEIATSSQHPRAFEVLAKLMDTVLNANKDLLDLQSKIRDIQAIDAPINGTTRTINNNLFVGSTAELQKVLSDMKNGQSS
jgi:multidrug efflux pump subunit AcrA (membrane-fusion protein)